MKKISLLNFIAFLSAFLLFQIELIVAKILLPQYGGSYMVWGACMVFFQATLFLGYFFSHLMIQRMGMPRYRLLFLFLLLLPLAFFPGRNLVIGMPHLGVPFAMDVFVQLFLTIGPVFFVLSTVSIVTQVWLAASSLPERANPYALYGWSNLGSFAGLFTYPLVFEFYWNLSEQLTLWRILYFALIVFSCLAYFLIKTNPAPASPTSTTTVVSQKDLMDWILLSAGGVVMFLSVTNILTMMIAPVPLLWVIPLGIYLLAFILNFKQRPWCPSWINEKIYWIVGFNVIFFFMLYQDSLQITVGIIILLFLLFVLSMYCQNQLLKRKPKDHGNLTFFYLMISLGGFIGGILTSWIIPLVSTSLIEFLVGLTLISLTMTPVESDGRSEGNWKALRVIVYLLFFMVALPLLFPAYHFWALIFIVLIFRFAFLELHRIRYAMTLFLLILVILCPFLEMIWENRVFIFKKRNYYGTYKVFDEDGMRMLHHGVIMHGAQFIHPNIRNVPPTYYGPNSPLAELLTSELFELKKMGGVGLGTGTLAQYVKTGHTLDFYELDPDVVYLAGKYFTFVNDSPGKINFILGDARLSLNTNKDQYDLLVVDAFAGDAVPVHLLTSEMMEIYRQHLTGKGILIIHTTNRYINLDQIAGGAAGSMKAKYAFKTTNAKKLPYETKSQWMAATWSEESFEKLVKLKWELKEPDRNARVWTDQYSNVGSAVKYDFLINSLKDFMPFYW